MSASENECCSFCANGEHCPLCTVYSTPLPPCSIPFALFTIQDSFPAALIWHVVVRLRVAAAPKTSTPEPLTSSVTCIPSCCTVALVGDRERNTVRDHTAKLETKTAPPCVFVTSKSCRILWDRTTYLSRLAKVMKLYVQFNVSLGELGYHSSLTTLFRRLYLTCALCLDRLRTKSTQAILSVGPVRCIHPSATSRGHVEEVPSTTTAKHVA